MDPADIARDEFAAKPAAFQARVRAEGLAIGERVVNHVLQILIGPKGGMADPAVVNHSSAVALSSNGRLLLATADHVYQEYCDKYEKDAEIIFQFGNGVMNPIERLLWRDSVRDLAVFEMRLLEMADIPSLVWQVPSWPPPPPDEGKYVAFAGYPIGYRVNGGPGQIHLNAVGGMMAVTSRSVHNIKCVLPRESLIPIKGPHVPPPGTKLGGMSGGPVFRWLGGTDIEFTGVITDFGDFFDMFWMATFDDVQF